MQHNVKQHNVKRKELYHAVLTILADNNLDFEATVKQIIDTITNNIDALTWREAKALNNLYIKSLSDDDRATYYEYMQTLYKDKIGDIIKLMQSECNQVD